MRSQKELAVILSRVPHFAHPKVRLEQYPTDSNVAAELLWFAHLQGDLDEKNVADYGCGTGILGFGALLLGAASVRFVDVDPEALEQAKKHYTTLKSEYSFPGEATFVCIPITAETIPVDTIIQNPPFGTRSPGADISFLRTAAHLGTITYTCHKTSTSERVEGEIKHLGGTITQRWDTDFLLRASYTHHTKRHERIKVSVWRIRFSNTAQHK